ncbi:SUMO-activating enzyme subunit 1 [Penaeus vannamei]|uniref:SUMO-activating enzyme subunit 1 n=1 Tax=Penaeus vannamei TaxID=6689 RepID=A0A423SJU6_PENVA|nr:SUMO-activating enzyme subunit 1 [Penaeus vannamei]
MVEKNLTNITEDEAALYDRQIRLWGLDAQKRLRSSRVLVAGVCGMGAEVTKNLVLSGIKSLMLLDHRNLTDIDVCANFLAPHDAVGQNIAEVSKERAQILNPMVEVSSDSDDIENKTDEFFKQFDVVCAMRCSKEQLLRISNICHQNKILFFGGDVFGMIGYMFADLQEHQYVEEVKEKVEVEQDGKKQTVEETKMVKRTENFVPLSQALDVDWTTTKYASQLRRTSSTYFIMHRYTGVTAQTIPRIECTRCDSPDYTPAQNIPGPGLYPSRIYRCDSPDYTRPEYTGVTARTIPPEYTGVTAYPAQNIPDVILDKAV